MTTKTKTDEYRVRVIADPDPESPREWGNLGKMYCWHRRYDLGDKHKYANPAEMHEDIDRPAEILPVYLYDHSGLTISTTRFSCPWDSGQVGEIVMSHKLFIAETGYATDEEKKTGVLGEESKKKCREMLVNEVAVYDQFLRGDVYGFIVEKREHCDTCDHDEWEEVNSCWGFYGTDFDNGMAEHIDKEHHELLKAALDNPEYR